MKYVFLFLVVFFSGMVQAKTDIAFVPKTVQQGNGVELVFSSDQPFQGVPNLDVLQKDFVIGGQQQKQSAEWINGKGSTTYQLIYTLFPNKSGKIVVKGLKIGSEVLPEIALMVDKNATYEAEGSLSLSVECPHTALYPAQKLFCQVTLIDTMGLVGGEIFPPEIKSGTLEQVLPLMPLSQTGSQKTYQSIFAFTPTQSGKIEMAPFTFKGEVRLKTSPPFRVNSMFDLVVLGVKNTATKPVIAQSKPLFLTVKEKPATYQGWWLPSPKVTLSEKYEMPTALHTGEPIMRILTLTAENVSAANLPVPSVPQTAGFKIYTNPEQRTDLPNGAELSVSMTFIPTQAGALVLPAITVPWFNPETNTIQEARVPEKEVFVSAAEIVSNPPETQKEELNTTHPVASKEVLPQPAETVQQPVAGSGNLPWVWIALGIILAFVGGIVVTILVLKHHAKQPLEAKKKKPLPDLYPF